MNAIPIIPRALLPAIDAAIAMGANPTDAVNRVLAANPDLPLIPIAPAAPVIPEQVAVPVPEAKKEAARKGAAARAAAAKEASRVYEMKGTVPTDGLAWCDAIHSLTTPRLLTADDPRAPDPVGFKGKLRPPQQTLLGAMLALEAKPRLAVTNHVRSDTADGFIQTRMGRIAEKFSSGKTVLALALACTKVDPARHPELASGVVERVSSNFTTHTTHFVPEITVRYGRFLQVTVIGAVSSVISQWEDLTKQFTDLRFFTIENVRSLREFERIYVSGEIGKYDLIFLKAGRVTSNFVVEGEEVYKREDGTPLHANRSLFEALGRVFEGVPVARLIIDDYDTLKLMKDDTFIPALFTWLISATRRQAPTRAPYIPSHGMLHSLILSTSSRRSIVATAHDDIVNRLFTLRCDPAYIDGYINTFAPLFRRVFVRGGRAAAIIRDLGAPAEAVEMLNAGAPQAAANACGLGPQVTTADIIRRVVGKKLGALQLAIRTLKRTDEAKAALGAKGTGRGLVDLPMLRRAVNDYTDDDFDSFIEEASGLSPAAATMLKELAEKAKESEAESGRHLSRMRDNIREGRCQCCTLEFGDPENLLVVYVLVGCCQILICEHCAKLGGKGFIKRCTNCASDIKPDSLMRVGAELDLSAALSNTHLLEVEHDIPLENLSLEEKTAPKPDNAPNVDINKIQALVQLAASEPVDCLKDDLVAPYVTGLLAGTKINNWPAAKPRKILVFAIVSESFASIRSELKERGVRHCTLQGTRAQRDEAVRQLREEPDMRIMLVASPKDCGGLHLPFLSHVVFYHRVIDRNVESQVAARGQRTGREHSLEVVTLLNEAEAADIPA